MKSFFLFIISSLIVSSCSQPQTEKILKEPQTIEQLGELLFFDSILSSNNTVSCASCHKPQFAFADNVPFSFGVDSAKGNRNTPTAMNQGLRNFFFHDGRAESLEEQAIGPIENPIEMNLPLTEAVNRLRNHKQYSAFFKKIFNEQVSKKNVIDAIVAYEKTLETSNSVFDNYMNKKDTSLFSESAKRGQTIFNEKGKCFDCHFGPDFTTDLFRNIGLFNGKELNDSGRYIVTKNITDLGKFKTPGLRNIAITKPYMHNGMFKTLREVIDYYNEPDKIIANSVNRDSLLLKPLHLNEQEKNDLETFLNSLTDNRFLK